MHRNALFLYALLAAGSGYTGQTVAPVAVAEKPGVSAVWLREADYWRFVKAGEVENYISLWHDNFIGWPCGQEHPLRKASIGDWVREVRDKHINVAYNLTREGAEEFGNIVVVHYSFTRVDTYPDGHVEGRGKLSKITHTWMRIGDTWQIIGGMCGIMSDAVK